MRQIEKFQRMGRILWAFRTGKTRLGYYPLRLWIEPTNSCNLKCPLCPQSEDDWQARGYLDYDLFRKIVDEVAGKVYDINLTHRGESLFNKRIYDMIAYAKARGIKVRLHTNATPLTSKNIDLLLGSGLDFLSISFDGYDKEGYEAARLGATYEDTLGKVLALLGRKRQLGLKSPYTVLQVIEGAPRTPRQDRVKNDLERMLRRASLDKFYVKSAHNWAGNIDASKVPAGTHGSLDEHGENGHAAAHGGNGNGNHGHAGAAQGDGGSEGHAVAHHAGNVGLQGHAAAHHAGNGGLEGHAPAHHEHGGAEVHAEAHHAGNGEGAKSQSGKGQGGRTKKLSACTFLWYSLTIQYGGIVNPCPQDWYGEMPLGDLRTQSVWDIWNGEPLIKLRQKMLDGDLAEYNVCQKCDRICRPTTFGIPHENLKNFASENLIGYRYLSRFVHR